MGESSLQQVGHILLDEHLVVGGIPRVQRCSDLPFLYQVEHVGQDGSVHRQTCMHTQTHDGSFQTIFPSYFWGWTVISRDLTGGVRRVSDHGEDVLQDIAEIRLVEALSRRFLLGHVLQQRVENLQT